MTSIRNVFRTLSHSLVSIRMFDLADVTHWSVTSSDLVPFDLQLVTPSCVGTLLRSSLLVKAGLSYEWLVLVSSMSGW